MPQVVLGYTNATLKDTFVNSYSPTTNHKTNSTLTMGKEGEAYRRAFIKFDLGLIPNNAIINSAILRLVTNGTVVSTVYVRSITQDFDLDNATWENQPVFGDVNESSFETPAINATPINADVTAVIQKQVNGESFGIALVNEESTKSILVNSNEATTTSYRPTLTIDYTIPTEDKKQVAFVGGNSHTTNLSPGQTITLNYPEGTKKGDVVLIGLHHSVKAPSIEGFTKLFETVTLSTELLSGYYKVVGDETSVSITAIESVNTIALTTFTNVKDVLNYPTSTRSGGSSTIGFPNDISDVPINSLVIGIHGITTTTTPALPLNFKELHRVSGNFQGRTYAVIATYNYSKTSYTAAEMKVTWVASNYNAASALVLTPITNEVPNIDGQDEYLGAFDTPIQKAYTAIDTEGDAVTIVEKLEGVIINTRNGAGTYTLDLSAQWDELSLGKHTVTIEANDDYANPPHEPRVRTWTFTKLMAVKPKPEVIDAGLSDVIAKFEGAKQMLVDKVGGSPLDTFEDILNKSNVMRYASGMATGSTSPLNFQYAGSTTTVSRYYVQVTDLPFMPKRIIVRGSSGTVRYLVEYSEGTDSTNGKTVKCSSFNATSVASQTNYNFKGDVLPAEVTATSFLLPVGDSVPNLTWEAWG